MADEPTRTPYPTDWRDLRERRGDAATEAPPDRFGPMGALDERSRRRTLRSVARTDSAPADLTAAAEGYRPPWSDLAYRPQRVHLPQPMTISHRGVELDPLFIWHPDNRTIYFDLAYPWGCVCRVITANGGTGSGVLIGPRHVLTASHCIDWSTDRAELVEVHRWGNDFLSAASFDTDVLAYTQVGASVPHTQLDEDYAVMVLAERLGDRFGWLGCRTYDSAWDDEGLWVTIGYPGDVSGGVGMANGIVPIYHNGVHLDEDTFDLGGARAMTTNADVMKGQSGSPFFAWWDNNPYVVAVVSAEGAVWASGDENWCSGGNDLTRLVNQARRDFP